MKLILALLIILAFQLYCAWCRINRLEDMICEIKDAPTADVQEVRHGKWITQNRLEAGMLLDELEIYVCSKCEHKCRTKTNFCSKCGAKMDV